MATRQAIREGVYDEIESAADGLVSADKITGEYPEQREELPVIVHNDSYRQVPMNTRSAPSRVEKNGSTVTEQYSVVMEAEFTVIILASSELEKESIYDAVRSHFEQFMAPIHEPEEIHPDAYYLTVSDVTSRNDDDREPTARGDAITMTLRYERLIDRDSDEVQTIENTGDTGNRTTT